MTTTPGMPTWPVHPAAGDGVEYVAAPPTDPEPDPYGDDAYGDGYNVVEVEVPEIVDTAVCEVDFDPDHPWSAELHLISQTLPEQTRLVCELTPPRIHALLTVLEDVQAAQYESMGQQAPTRRAVEDAADDGDKGEQQQRSLTDRVLDPVGFGQIVTRASDRQLAIWGGALVLLTVILMVFF